MLYLGRYPQACGRLIKLFRLNDSKARPCPVLYENDISYLFVKYCRPSGLRMADTASSLRFSWLVSCVPLNLLIIGIR